MLDEARQVLDWGSETIWKTWDGVAFILFVTAGRSARDRDSLRLISRRDTREIAGRTQRETLLRCAMTSRIGVRTDR
jgi:hypothetical protein